MRSMPFFYCPYKPETVRRTNDLVYLPITRICSCNWYDYKFCDFVFAHVHIRHTICPVCGGLLCAAYLFGCSFFFGVCVCLEYTRPHHTASKGLSCHALLFLDKNQYMICPSIKHDLWYSIPHGVVEHYKLRYQSLNLLYAVQVLLYCGNNGPNSRMFLKHNIS